MQNLMTGRPNSGIYLASLLLLLLITSPAHPQDDWQQTINYKLDVTLDDEAHFLRGQVTIQYVNHSPDTLQQLYFHCWPNAYSSKETPFARQLLENGKTSFHFAEREAMGFLDSLSFTSNGEPLSHRFRDPHKEIGILALEEPLPPGQRVTVRTPFRVKIPETFSRLGHNKQAYQISQWYPKIAAYDEEGWHPMPYLNQGEYYNDFGRYEVSITLPSNYKVGATGRLQNPAEKQRLQQLSKQTREAMPFKQAGSQSIPASSDSMKTLTFEQENVHDFAWFADKRFRVLIDTVPLPGTARTVETYTFFLPQNQEVFQQSPAYIRAALQTLSRQVGPYSYETYTVVNGAPGAGAGMEYPTITVVGSSNPETTIFHEVTHNWFQGELAFNERRYPYLDEGLTSFYENRYFEDWTDSSYLSQSWPILQESPINLMDAASKLLAHQQGRVAKDQAPGSPSSRFTSLNYFSMVYGKAAWLFQYLYGYLGPETFDSAMQQFYQQYQFQHPGPADLQRSFQQVTKDSLNWFFEDLMLEGRQLDYAVKGFANEDQTRIRVANEGQVAGPVLVSLFREEALVAKKWVEGFEGEQTIRLPDAAFDKVKINSFQWVPEHNYRNNTLFSTATKNWLDPLSTNVLVNPEFPGSNEVQLTPAFQWNNNDGFLLGGLVTNSLLPSQSLDMVLMPLYGFKSNNLAGSGQISLSDYSQNAARWQKWQVGIKGKRFSHESQPRNLTYSKLRPSVEYRFKERPLRTSGLHTLSLESHWIWREEYLFNREADQAFTQEASYYVNELTYRYQNQQTLKPFESAITLQQHSDFVKAMAEVTGELPYDHPDQGLRFRLFGGQFLHNTNDMPGEYSFLLGNRFSGNNSPYTDFRDNQDYLYEHSLLDRGARSGALGNQVWVNNGFLKAPTAFGNSTDWLLSANLMTTVPGNTPLRLFADAGTSSTLVENTGEDLSYDAGAALVLWQDVLELYYPVVFSEDLENVLDNNNVTGWDRLQFRLNIEPYKLLNLRQRIGSLRIFQ